MTSTDPTIAALNALLGADISAADAAGCQRLLGDVRRLRGFLDSAEARLLGRVDALAAVGESFGSEDVGARCSGVSSREAGKRKRRSKTLDQAAGFDTALAAGDVTAEHVDQLASATASLTDEVRGSLFDRVDDLLAHACAHDPARFGRHVRDLARNLERDAGISRERQQRANTSLSWKVAADGMYDVHARLQPLLGNRLIRLIDAEVAARIAAGEAAGDPEFVDRSVNRRRLAAEALVDLATSGHQMARPIVAEISVLIDADTLATGAPHDDTVSETSHGAPLPITSVRALMCMGVVTPVMLDTSGTVVDLGRTTRTPSRTQRRALRAMYRTCVADGCEVLFDRCEMHHIIEWERLGVTDLDNLVPLCAHHHHETHRHHWRLHLAPDRTLTVTDQRGDVVMVTTPDMPHRSRRPERPLQPAPAGDPHRQRLAS